MPSCSHSWRHRPKCLIAGLAGHLLLSLFVIVPARAGAPQWIGGPPGRALQGQAAAGEFKKSISIDQAVHSASMKFAADFCTAVVVINGQTVLALEPYCPAQEIEVMNALRRGRNEICITTTRVAGPAAVALSITLVGKDSQSTTIATDETWQGAVALGEVPPEQWGIGRRSAAVSAFDNYEQWQQARGNAPDKNPQFWAVPGFEITPVRKAAADEGSWIALAFDDAGRATISREDTGLLRMTLADDRRSVARVEPIAVDLPECRGLVYLDGRLYANANNAKTMFRLRLTEDAQVEELERFREFPGGGGHGRNDLALGHDGLIYSIHGDSVEAPGQPIVDRTSPLRESRRGPPQQEAYVVRTDRQGQTWELFCTGLRNPYGLAFHPSGDLFTYDADNEYDMGTPWYRPTRIVQLVSGADYGYRVAQGRWPPNYPDHPDNGLATIDVGRGSPTAVMFGTNLKYPTPYREALFVLDWAYGRVLAVHLAPRGAGYRAALELFLQGKPLNVTDIAAGPDGAMWLITGGRKTQSALYRVAFSGEAERTTVAKGPHELEAARFSEKQRTVRLELEALFGREGPDVARLCWPHLADPDPRIRHAARIAMEQRPKSELFNRFDEFLKTGSAGLPENPYTGKLEYLMTLARTGDPAIVPTITDRLLEIPVRKLDLGAQFTVVFLYSECLRNAPEAVANRRDAALGQLAELWPDPVQEGFRVSPLGDNFELRRRLALLLANLGDAKLGDTGVVDRIAGSLFTSSVQEDRLQGLLALRNVKQGWTPASRQAYFQVLRDAARFVGGEGLPTFLERLRADAVATLSDAERSQFADLLSAPQPVEEPLPPSRPKVQAWSFDDLSMLAATDGGRGDAERGAKVFRDALCSRCHRAGLTGPAVGPDLTFAARRFSRSDMLESIIAPSRSVAENYRNVMVVTEAGKVYVGRLLNEGDFRTEKLKLSTDSLRPGQIVEIDKKDIVEERLHDTSPMPLGLLDSFTRAEIADLLTFLEDGTGNSK